MMSKREFVEYIKKNDKEDPEPFDRDMLREEWLQYVQQFFDRILSYLKELIESNDITVKYHAKTINESSIGEYNVQRMILWFKRNEVVLDPIGRNIIGAKGRIDMKSNAGKVRFVLVNKKFESPVIKVDIKITDIPKLELNEPEKSKIELDWKIATPPPDIKYINLTEDTFFDALMEIVNA
jgi:hypothetical protein